MWILDRVKQNLVNFTSAPLKDFLPCIYDPSINCIFRVTNVLLLHFQYCIYVKHPNKHNQQINVKAISKKKIQYILNLEWHIYTQVW